MVAGFDVVAQTDTPAPEAGPTELPDLLPILIRAGWFAAGFLVVSVVGFYLVEPAVARIVRRRNPDNSTIQEAISRYVQVVVLLLAVVVGTAVAGYGRLLGNSALVVAAVTVVLGVAGQTVIGSLVSGMALVFDSEFNVGDYIEWGDREGTVESITLRVTRIRTPDGEYVTVPNTILTDQAVTRPYSRGRYRVVEHVGIAYDDEVDAALTHLEAAAGELPSVRTHPEPTAYVEEFGGDAVLLRTHYWIDEPTRRDVFAVRSDYAQVVKRRLETDGITISPPSKRDLEGRIAVEGSG
jgi:small-conductance mechanosensitive channel